KEDENLLLKHPLAGLKAAVFSGAIRRSDRSKY
ncbi:hypothetical protein PAT3040_02676, partial [Paenibacillus agaridevorans]